jgi:hypothetical protein
VHESRSLVVQQAELLIIDGCKRLDPFEDSKFLQALGFCYRQWSSDNNQLNAAASLPSAECLKEVVKTFVGGPTADVQEKGTLHHVGCLPQVLLSELAEYPTVAVVDDSYPTLRDVVDLLKIMACAF